MNDLLAMEERITKLEKLLVSNQNNNKNPAPLIEKLNIIEKSFQEYDLKPESSFSKKSSFNFVIFSQSF